MRMQCVQFSADSFQIRFGLGPTVGGPLGPTASFGWNIRDVVVTGRRL